MALLDEVYELIPEDKLRVIIEEHEFPEDGEEGWQAAMVGEPGGSWTLRELDKNQLEVVDIYFGYRFTFESPLEKQPIRSKVNDSGLRLCLAEVPA